MFLKLKVHNDPKDDATTANGDDNGNWLVLLLAHLLFKLRQSKIWSTWLVQCRQSVVILIPGTSGMTWTLWTLL